MSRTNEAGSRWLLALALIACGGSGLEGRAERSSAALGGPIVIDVTFSGTGAGGVTVRQGAVATECPGGVDCPVVVTAGEPVTLEATAYPGSTLFGFKVPFCEAYDCTALWADPTFMPPDPYWWSGGSYTFTPAADRTVGARFVPAVDPPPATVTLTLSLGGAGVGAITGTAGPSGTASDPPIAWSTGAACTGTTCTAAVPVGGQVRLIAVPDAQSTFSGFQAPYCEAYDCAAELALDPEWYPPAWASVGSPYAFGMGAARAVSARFDSQLITLRAVGLSSAYGTYGVSAAGTPFSPTWPDLAPCATASGCPVRIPVGEVLTLSAPQGGNGTGVFKGWGGACTGTGACKVTMSAARSVTAFFGAYVPPVSYTLTPTVSGVLPADVAAVSIGRSPAQASYASGTVVTLSAPPTFQVNGDQYRFVRWSGCTPTAAQPPNVCSVAMTYNRAVTALYVQQFTLTLTIGPGTATSPYVMAGSATCTPGSPCAYTLDKGAVVNLSAFAGATPALAYARWTNVCGNVYSTGCSFSVSANLAAAATFP